MSQDGAVHIAIRPIDKITVRLARANLAVPWDARQALLAQFGNADAASRRTPRRHQVVGLLGVRTHTSKNVVRSWPETSSKTASKSSVVAVDSS